jgi:hypothetical protein
MTVSYIVIGVLLVVTSVGFYNVGKRRGRREVVYTFQDILLQIYRLIWTGQQGKLREFISDVCGEHTGPVNEGQWNDKNEPGYT